MEKIKECAGLKLGDYIYIIQFWDIIHTKILDIVKDTDDNFIWFIHEHGMTSNKSGVFKTKEDAEKKMEEKKKIYEPYVNKQDIVHS